MSNNAASTKHKNSNLCRDYTCPACYPALSLFKAPQTDLNTKILRCRVGLSDGSFIYDPYGVTPSRRAIVGRLCLYLPKDRPTVGPRVAESTDEYRNNTEFGMLFFGQLYYGVEKFQLAALIGFTCGVEVVAMQWFEKKQHKNKSKKNGAWVAVRGGTTAAQIVIDQLDGKALCFPHNHFFARNDAEVGYLDWFAKECRPCLIGGAANRLTVKWSETDFVQQPPNPSSDDEDGSRGAPLPSAPLAAPAQKPFATSGRKPTG